MQFSEIHFHRKALRQVIGRCIYHCSKTPIVLCTENRAKMNCIFCWLISELIPHLLQLIPNGVKGISTFSGMDVLMTTSSSSHGLLFDIQIHSNVPSVTIVGLDMLIEATYPVGYEIYTKTGSWQDNETYPEYHSAFHLISNGTIRGAGTSDLSRIPLDEFRDVMILGGATQSFYVSLNESSLLVQNYIQEARIDDGVLATLASTPELDILYGSAVLQHPLDSADPMRDFHSHKGFLGRIFYTENAEEVYVEEAEDTDIIDSPTLNPTTMEPKISSSLEPTTQSRSPTPSPSALPSVNRLPSMDTSVSLVPSVAHTPNSNLTYPMTNVSVRITCASEPLFLYAVVLISST